MSFHLSYTGDEVQSLLEMAGTALQEHQDLSNYYTKGEVDDAILEETIIVKIYNMGRKPLPLKPKKHGFK